MKLAIKIALLFISTFSINVASAKDLFFKNTERLNDFYKALYGDEKFLSPTRIDEINRNTLQGDISSSSTQIGSNTDPRYLNERDVTKPLELDNYYVNSVIYKDDNNWTVWINGEYYDAKKNSGDGFTILKTSPNRIVLLIDNLNIQNYDSFFSLKLMEHSKSDYWKYISADGRIVVNPQKNQIRVVLDARQQFAGWMMSILPHRERENETKKILHPLLADKSEYKNAGKEYYRY